LFDVTHAFILRCMDMQTDTPAPEKNKLIGPAVGLAVLLVLGVAVWYFAAHKTATAPTTNNTDTASSTENASTTDYTLPDGSVLHLPPGAIVTEEDVSAPNYKKPLVYKVETSAEVKAAMEAKFTTLTAALAKNPQDFGAWIALGGLRKIGGDYAGAAEIWTYVSLLYPSSEVAFNNLGDLYMNFIKDYPKAEANYRQVIAINPRYIEAYLNLSLMYRELYKTNTSAAKDILTEGLKKNPDNAQLKAALAAYQSSSAQ
jgi:tetratricopeptide (TPR) repeat protein